jgi:hypothetical protein
MNENNVSPIKDRVLILPESRFVSVVRIRVSIRCQNCGNQWGVSYSSDTLILPLGWDFCKLCEKKQGE